MLRLAQTTTKTTRWAIVFEYLTYDVTQNGPENADNWRKNLKKSHPWNHRTPRIVISIFYYIKFMPFPFIMLSICWDMSISELPLPLKTMSWHDWAICTSALLMSNTVFSFGGGGCCWLLFKQYNGLRVSKVVSTLLLNMIWNQATSFIILYRSVVKLKKARHLVNVTCRTISRSVTRLMWIGSTFVLLLNQTCRYVVCVLHTQPT